jgi:RIO kinase 1
MEMVDDGEGNPAPRLGDLDFTPEAAVHFHAVLVQEVVRMLCAGLVHGDLSEYNILFDAEGPVIIDLPQAVDAAANAHARGMLERDVRNLAVYFGQYAPELLQTNYEKEIWDIYESGELTPETHLTGQAEEDDTLVDLVSIFAAIDDAKREEAQRRAAAAEQDE